MRIGINTRLLQEKHHTGIQNYIKNLYQAVIPLDKGNKYLLLENNQNKNLLSKIAFDGFKVKQKMRDLDINIFHSPTAILPFGKKPCPYIATVHDLWFKTIPQIGNIVDTTYYNFAFRHLVKTADIIVVDSLAIKSEVLKYSGIPGQRIKVIPLGTDDFYLQEENPAYLKRIREKYGLENKRIVFTNSCHSKRKNLDILADVFLENEDDLKNTVLVASGVIDQAKFRAKTKKNILLLGYLTPRENRALYRIADIFIYPSFYEGFGLPILEAMASNCLVLASNIPAFKEIITDNNLLFSPHNQKEIYEKIKALLEAGSERKNAVLNGYPKILEEFSWQKSAEAMITVFNSFK